MHADIEKQAAAHAAANVVTDGMTVGLGTGTTVEKLLPVLAARGLALRCVATSPRTHEAAAALGLDVEPFGSIDRFDVTIDGADQIAPDGWLVKGGGAAHTREKIVAAAAERFIVIADSSKSVAALHSPIPLELMGFGLAATVRHLESRGGLVMSRAVPASPDGGVIADYHGVVDDPAEIDLWLSSLPGVVQHGLFPPSLVSDIFVATASGIEHRRVGG
jgi:ribose 5-phosphate isomerase A